MYNFCSRPSVNFSEKVQFYWLGAIHSLCNVQNTYIFEVCFSHVIQHAYLTLKILGEFIENVIRRHIHDRRVRRRDMIKCYNQREVTRHRDRDTGLSTVSYRVQTRKEVYLHNVFYSSYKYLVSMPSFVQYISISLLLWYLYNFYSIVIGYQYRIEISYL